MSYDPELPRFALSVRQPWAWAIVHAGKRLENRGPMAVRHMKARAKPPVDLCIHAAKGMTRDEYESARAHMTGMMGIEIPLPFELIRGCIIGTARWVDVIGASSSPWFVGPKALVLEDMAPIAEPIPCRGALGLFTWRSHRPEHRPDWRPEWGTPELELPLAWMKAWPGVRGPGADGRFPSAAKRSSLPLFEEEDPT